MLESLFDKKRDSNKGVVLWILQFFTNIFFYGAPLVAVSRWILSNISNSNLNSIRSLFINYINPNGTWGPKPNNKIVTSKTSSLSFVLEPPKAYSKDSLRKKMPTEMWEQNLRFYQNSTSFLIILAQFLSLWLSY